MINSAVNAGLGGGVAGGSAAAGSGTVASALPTIGVGGAVPTSLGGLPTAAATLPTITAGSGGVLPSATSLAGVGGASAGGTGAATGSVAGAGTVASSLPTIGVGGTVPTSLGGLPSAASSALPTATSSLPTIAAGHALPTSLGGLPSAVSTLPTMTYPTVSGVPASTLGGTAGGAGAASGGMNTANLAGNISRGIGATANSFKAALPNSPPPQVAMSQPTMPNLMGGGGIGNIPALNFGSPAGIPTIGNMQPLPSLMPNNLGSLNPTMTPMAFSDLRVKQNIRAGQEEMNQILNTIYRRLVKIANGFQPTTQT